MEDGKSVLPRLFELTRSKNTAQIKAEPDNFDIYATTWTIMSPRKLIDKGLIN